MSNTLKATKLDFSLVKPYIKVIGFTMLLPIAFAAINRSILTGVSFAMCFIAMTTGYTFSVTEKNFTHQEKRNGNRPVSLCSCAGRDGSGGFSYHTADCAAGNG